MIDDVASIVLDPKEISLKVSERQRCRFLRNISPPYDNKGKWRRKNDSLKKIKKRVRKTAAARSAFSSWLCFFLLSLLLLLVVAHYSDDRQKKYSQNAVLNQWFKDGFSVDKNLVICPSSYNQSGDEITFGHVSDFPSWKHWMKAVFPLLNNGIKLQTSDHQNKNCNSVILSFVKIFKFQQPKKNDCKSLPLPMQKILADERYCQESRFGNSTSASGPLVEFINLAQPSEMQNFKHEIDNQLDGIELLFVVYNKITKIYSLVRAFSPFSNPFLKSKVTVYSVSLDCENSMTSTWLLLTHLPLLLWVIVQGLSGILFIIRKHSWKKIRRRNQVKNNSVKLLDVLLWIAVVAYLFTASLLRLYVSKSAETFEKSSHLYQDPQSVLEKIIGIDLIFTWVLGFWTVLLALKLLNIAITHHGFRSELSRGISAVRFSMKRSFLPLLNPLFVIILIICLVNLFCSFLLYDNPDDAVQLFPKAVFYFWLNLVGRVKEIGAEKLLNSRIKVLYYVIVFIGTRILFKGLLIASHQWYFHRSKNFTFRGIFSKKGEKFIKKREQKKKKAKSTNSKTMISKQLKLHRSHLPTSQNITLKELVEENLKGFQYSFSVLCSSLIFTMNRMFGCSLHGLWRGLKFQHPYQESTESATSQNASESVNHVTFAEYDYDKSKIDDEFWTSDLVKNQDSFLMHENQNFDCYKNSDETVSQNYNLPAETALSEVNFPVLV